MLSTSLTDILEITIEAENVTILNSDDFYEEMKNAITEGDEEVVLNMGKVNSIDSSAIATLVKIIQMLSGNKRTMYLSNVNDDIRKIFDTLHVTNFFKLK